MTNILHISPFFSPNIGGVETHLLDLISELDKLSYKNTVLTYSPITTRKVSWQARERYGKSSYLRRFRWIGFNLFHRFEKLPMVNIFYITPYLLFRSILWLVFRGEEYSTIHSHGINAAMVGIAIQRIFQIPRHIVSIYSTYDNVPLNNISTKIMVGVLNNTDRVLTQSQKSIKQLCALGVARQKVFLYRHWINLDQFKPIDKKTIRQKFKLENKFSVLFIGRMIPQKGAIVIAKVACQLPMINFLFVGDGPDFAELKKMSLQCRNIILFGNVDYQNLHNYYNLADIFCLPSLYNEGWGRVVMEALACGLPVIISDRGAAGELINDSVGVVVKPTASNFKKSIKAFYKDKKLFEKLKSNSCAYARKHYSASSVSLITRHYL